MIQISSSGYFHNAGTYIYGTKEGNYPAEGLPINVNQYGTLVIFAGNGDGGYGYGFALYATTHEDNPFLSVYTRQSGWGKIITDNNFDLSGYVPFAADIPSNQKFYMALVPGDENKIYFYSGEKPTAEYAIGYIALTKSS